MTERIREAFTGPEPERRKTPTWQEKSGASPAYNEYVRKRNWERERMERERMRTEPVDSFHRAILASRNQPPASLEPRKPASD